MTEIKEEVYSLAWELFYGESLYFVNMEDFNHFNNYFSFKSEHEQIWAILSEILPAEIHIVNEIEFCMKIKRSERGICVYYHDNGLDPSLSAYLPTIKFEPNIWHSLHSLLVEIKALKEKEGDNLKFVWGNNKRRSHVKTRNY